MIFLLLLLGAALAVFYLIVFRLDMPGAWKFGLVVAEMLVVNQVLIRRYRLPSEIGLILLKSRKGIEMIESLARSETAFNFIADVGAAMSYGLLSLRLMRRNVSLPTLAVGLVLLAVLSVFVAPVALGFLLYVVGIGAASKSAGMASSGGADLGLIFVAALLVLGGLFLLILFGIVYYGLVIFKALVTTIFFGTGAIATTSAGGDILLPGVNLPFFEGIAALAIVMVVHEGAHAVLARIAKVPILSSGIVLFGIIPVGAFVEPDEGKLMKSDEKKQTRVLVAGPTANMLTALAFFALFSLFFMATTDSREGAYFVVQNESSNFSALPPGTVIYEIGGKPVDSLDPYHIGLEPNSNITILTNRGTVTRMTDANGRIGITFLPIDRSSMFSRYGEPALQFIYIILGLGVALNFVVGTVNILPIPLFDGYRIVDVNVKNKLLVKALSYTALAFFILNFVPRLFQ